MPTATMLRPPSNRSSQRREVITIFQHLFGDDFITATDLNRKPGEVLDRATRRPITITRNNDAFALLPRKLACRLARGHQDAIRVVELLCAVMQHRAETLRPDSDYDWLQAFNDEELNDLLQEILDALRDSLRLDASDTDEEISVNTILQEWQKSAEAILSTEHGEAFQKRDEEASVPLTDPTGDRGEKK